MARLGFGRVSRAPSSYRRKPDACSSGATSPSSKHLDELGYDEFWCGEHHSSGWEMIASPEMFLAAAGEHHQAHQARDRRDLAALPPSLQRRAAHGAARPR
jgi:alkanesulfonate monooxygenase SsuD/methylene tetrahydromethanopterin reductase-like flavin-dependent oxidoreductase (luciferase family)